MKSIYIKFKYLFDYPLSLVLIFILLPVYILCSFLILISGGPPIFFIQERVGLKKKEFFIIKFRTMNSSKLSEKQRVTYLGKYMRSLKIDELPQLFNILRGEMSFIGPRPLLPEYNDLFTSKQNIRFDIKPGLTGLSQIKVLEKKNLSWYSKLNFDRIYVKKHSFLFDMYIIFKTIKLILKRIFFKKNDYDNFEKLK